MYIQYIWPFRASPIGQKSFAIRLIYFLPSHERKYLFMLYRKGHRQGFQKHKYGRSVLEISTCKFAQDKWMTGNLSIVEQIHKPGVSLP
ncbi:MAG: hypothetical protein ABSC19_04855 [Syntrophorhabdales bacterium]